MLVKLSSMIAALAVLTACAPATTAHSTPMIGVLEERPGAHSEEAARFVVRAMFHKEADGWRAYDLEGQQPSAIPQETNWTISLNGAELGQLTAHAPQSWALLADIGHQELAPGATAPTSGERSTTFAGWQDTPLHRPLVATSPGAFANPQPWSEAETPAETQTALRQTFRAEFTDVTNCADAEAPAAPRAYTDRDIAISNGLVSSSGWRLATLQLTGYNCDGPYEGAYISQTYAVSPAGDVRHLGEGLRFLDSGDYDADGEPEIIFLLEGYNLGGYQLYSGDFSQNATFQFGYH